MKNKTRLFFRADGNSQIGLGHVVRLLALAELLREDFNCVFAIQNPSEALQAQIKTSCPEIIILPETGKESGLLAEAETLLNQFTGQEIMVLDGYQFPTKYQQILKQKGSILVCLDDLHDRHFVADAIINIAGGIAPENYSAAAYTKFCLGPQFALLRKPFRDAQKTLPLRDEKVLKVMVCFGGADPENFTLQFVKNLLDSNPDLQIEIVTGSAYRHTQTLQDFVAGKHYINWSQNLPAEAMAAVMQECKIAVCSASSVGYEYCAITGMLFLVKTADNQEGLFNFLISQNLALPASEIARFLNRPDKQTQTETLSQNQRKIFNGQAEENLRKLFSQFELQARLSFREVTPLDEALLFEWANDPVVRQFSFNPEPIPFETHVNWLNSKLANPNALLFLAEVQKQPAALLRFDLAADTALISYQIGAAFRGQGLGHRVLQVGLQKLKQCFPGITNAIGYVQPVNTASVRAFEKAEFVNLGIDKEHQAYKFIIQI